MFWSTVFFLSILQEEQEDFQGKEDRKEEGVSNFFPE